MFVLWGVLPLGWWGRRIGIALFALSAVFIFGVSPRRHGDDPADWGLGTWPRTLCELGLRPRPAPRPQQAADDRSLCSLVRGVFLTFNLLVIAVVVSYPELASEFCKGVLRYCLGVKIAGDLPRLPVLAGTLFAGNALLGVTRWDNLRAASRLVGAYVAGLAALIAIGGGLYVYGRGGFVVLNPVRGLVSMTTYVIWGMLQELLFLGYFNTRIRKGVQSERLAVLLTAVIFSLFHLRAYALMGLCFLVMHVWAPIFMRAPNLVALAIAHGISGGFGRLFEVKGIALVHIKASVGPFNP